MLPALGTALLIGTVCGIGSVVTYTVYKATGIGQVEEKMVAPRTEEARQAYHERVYGKGSPSPIERLGRGETLNDLLPMPPENGPPLPRALGIRWPWRKKA